MKTIKQLMQEHAGKWPRDPRAPRNPLAYSPSREWRGRPFPFPVDTGYKP